MTSATLTSPASHYTSEEINSILNETGITLQDLAEYIAWDFIDEGEELPTADELISHIDYQQSLLRIGSMTDDETEFGHLWAMEHCF